VIHNHLKKIGSRLARQDGQSMVEFAIVLLPLCVVLFGITQFGLAFKRYLQVTDAARVGARAAAVSRGGALTASASTACAAATTAAQTSAGPTVTVTCTPSSGSIAPGTPFQVAVQWPTFDIDVVGIVVKDDVALTGTATERME
jgi:Flp pilus assembly protein TadG